MKYTIVLLLISSLIACSDSTQEEPAAGSEAARQQEQGAEMQAAAQAAAEEEAARLKAEQEAQAAHQAHIDEGNAYLHINAQKPDVKVMESGLQFEILEQGDGKSPGLTSRVVTHYHGTFINGDVFDSSVERDQPAEFPVNRVIPGWTEALQMMKEGDVWRLVIPSHLGYGKRGAGDTIPPDTVLVFEVELLEVKG